jgi:predicted nucleotidyltransferase
MRKRPRTDLFHPSNPLKVLSFLADDPGREYLGSEILSATSMSRAGVYLALQELVAAGLADKRERGRFHLYSVDPTHPLVKQFKVLKNTVLLQPLLSQLRPLSVKIILFGSSGRGEDLSSSDIDIFILARNPETIRGLVASFSCRRTIQPVIVVPAEWPAFQKRERVFADEISRGILLWEEADEPGLSRLSEEGKDTTVLKRKSPGRKGARVRRIRSSPR